MSNRKKAILFFLSVLLAGPLILSTVFVLGVGLARLTPVLGFAPALLIGFAAIGPILLFFIAVADTICDNVLNW